MKFNEAGLKFINDISNRVGDDLIYSLALENGNVFLCVAAHPSLTSKKFDTGNERILFLIQESEYEVDQNKLVDHLVDKINEHIIVEN